MVEGVGNGGEGGGGEGEGEGWDGEGGGEGEGHCLNKTSSHYEAYGVRMWCFFACHKQPSTMITVKPTGIWQTEIQTDRQILTTAILKQVMIQLQHCWA